MGTKKSTLSKQLIQQVLITFLPVNLLAILVCGIILIQVSGQVRESYQRELDTVMDQMQDDLMATEDVYSNFLLEYMTELTILNGEEAMAPYDMIRDLENVFEQSDGEGIYYLYEKGEERLYLRYNSSCYSAPLIEEVKGTLLAECIQADLDRENVSREWHLKLLEGKYFLYRQYDYANYRVGLLCDMERFLILRGSSRLWQDNRIYLKSDGQVYYYTDGKLNPDTELEWDQIFHSTLLQHNAVWTNDNPDIAVGIEMVGRDFRGGVPVAYWVLMVVAVCSVFLAVGMWMMLKKRVVKALHLLKSAMDELENEHLSYRIQDWDPKQAEEFTFLYERFNSMAGELELSREKDIKMYQVQLDNLRLQVNPHMLLNSFNMIYCLAQSKNYECIQRYSMLLVEYFRYALKDTGQLVTLQKEMEFVENYIAIQKIRFPGAFTSVYNVQEECGEALIPPLMVENFVENAMKYALNSGSMIEVLINIRKEEDRLLISVCDTGRGIKPEVLECLQKGEIYVDNMNRQHIGVWNCRRRLEVFYGETAKLNIISSQGEGTQVWLDLPFLTEADPGVGKGDTNAALDKTGI